MVVLKAAHLGWNGWNMSDIMVVCVRGDPMFIAWVIHAATTDKMFGRRRLNKPRIRNFPRIRNWESETKNCDSDTKVRESKTKQTHESETKKNESETKSNLPLPLNILLNEILPPTYPHKGSNPPPSLAIMLNEICLQHIPIPVWPLYWMGYYLQSILIRDQIWHPLWPLYWMGYYLQSILIRDQIWHPLWPLYWMGYYLQSILIRDQIRHPLWPLCLMRYYLQPPFVRYQNPPTPSEHFVEWDIAFSLSPKEIKSATPSGHFVE